MRLTNVVLLTLIGVLLGCASYYELNHVFNQNFEKGNIEAASNLLDDNKKAAGSKTRFLYYANQGVVNHLLGNYHESNEWLEQAYLFGEDYQKNYLNFAGSYFLNPNLIVYPGEDHEHLMLLYYKALNYLKMDSYDEALVEVRRMNQRLIELGDKYNSESKYQKDAFVNNLMGIIYDASGDYNNAFIAYRNSLSIYQKEFSDMFGLEAPEQLKRDLLRTAYLAGFHNEMIEYENDFGLKYEKQENSGGYLIFFWHNGLAPVKEEWGITFFTSKGDNGYVNFYNEEYGLSFSFYYDGGEDDPSISDLSGTRVVFPKYVEREPYFESADLLLNNEVYELELAEDINAIAFKTLNQRMLEELGKGLLRVALKKAIENEVRKEDETLGFVVSMINLASEQADTRNWQTLPHNIHYTRVPLSQGENKIIFRTRTNQQHAIQEFQFTGKPGTTQFQTYQSLESKVAF